MPNNVLNLVPQSAFKVTHNLPLPGEMRFCAVSPIVVNWKESSASGFHDRNGTENHRIVDPGVAEFPAVTFTAHANKDDAKSIFETFKKVGEGDTLRGDITVEILNPKKEFSTLVSITLHELTVQSYNPGFNVDADQPNTVEVTMTVLPNRISLA